MKTSCIIKKLFVATAFLIFLVQANAQLTVDAGNDTTFCGGYGQTDSLFLGNNIMIENGIPPYSYRWETRVELSQNLVFTASDFLSDTTAANPYFTDGQTLTNTLIFYLHVTDAENNTATDSIAVGFSGCGCTTGTNVIFLNKGDSVWLDAGKPQGKYARYYWEPSYGLSNPDSSATWCKPEETTSYNLVSIDTFGCSCSCPSVEIRIGWNDFAPIGAKWYYSKLEGTSPPNEGYVMLEAIKDTTIQDVKCRVISKKYYHANGTDITHLGHEFVHESDNKIIYWRNGNFYTLYDFNAQPGDEWTVCGSYINEGFCVYDSLETIHVDSVSLIKINNHVLRVLYTSSLNSNWEYPDKIIERIGCLSYLFPQPKICAIDIPYEAGPLRCYSDNLFGRFKSEYWQIADKNCDELIIYNNIENFKNKSINISPNPAKKEINIQSSPEITIYGIGFYDLNGTLLYYNKTARNHFYKINVAGFPKGIYILKVKTGGGEISQRVVIQ